MKKVKKVKNVDLDILISKVENSLDSILKSVEVYLSKQQKKMKKENNLPVVVKIRKKRKQKKADKVSE